jgi:hypothetical protein
MLIDHPDVWVFIAVQDSEAREDMIRCRVESSGDEARIRS